MTLGKGIARAVLVAGLLLGGAAVSLAQTAFDMAPEQKDRVHTVKGDAANLIPRDFKFVQSGKLTVAVAPFLPPTEFFATDDKTVIGVNIDLASLIAEKLGLTLDTPVVAFPDWPLGVTTGKYDAFMSDITVTEERKQKFDFSTYGNDVIGFYVPVNSKTTSIKEPKDISGLRVTTGAGTNHEKILLAWNKKEQDDGLAPAELQYFDDPTAAHLSLMSGRSDVSVMNNSEGAYAAATTNETKNVGLISGGWPMTAELGVVTRKDSGLAAAITEAINELIADGTYGATLKRWGLDGEAIQQSRTNPPGLKDF